VGIIEEIIDNGSQQILQIVRGEYEVLVPAVDAFMIKRDEETRTLQIEAPDGLIDLYS
jgi:16S rRNA processing protein RimM